MLHQDIGIHDCDKLMEEVRLGVKQLWGQFLHHGLQLFSCGGRHSIPRLRFTPVKKFITFENKTKKADAI